MDKAFVTYLGTDAFLPGVLTLNESLKRCGNKYELLVMVTDGVSEVCLQILGQRKLKTKMVQPIENPCDLAEDARGFRHMYTKLRLFDLVEYRKIVYIDADILVCSNIELLFDRPHLSAVVAGGLMPENESWRHLNAGLMVIEPDGVIADKITSLISVLPSSDGSDQGFLHSFYPHWPQDGQLHLDHGYNAPFCYLDDYCSLHGYIFQYKRKRLTTNIALVHYWGMYKPWHMDVKTLNRKSDEKWEQALLLWWDTFNTLKIP